MAPMKRDLASLSRLVRRADCRFVEREEFCRLLIGSGRLVRSDERTLSLRGLLDVETGIRFFIQQEKLMPTQLKQSQAN